MWPLYDGAEKSATGKINPREDIFGKRHFFSGKEKEKGRNQLFFVQSIREGQWTRSSGFPLQRDTCRGPILFLDTCVQSRVIDTDITRVLHMTKSGA